MGARARDYIFGAARSGSHGFYEPNNWKRSKNGERYSQGIGAEGSPDVQRRAADLLAALGPRVDAINEHYAATRGWTPSPTGAVWERPGFKAEGYGQEVIPPALVCGI
jgi:hypothetical protein